MRSFAGFSARPLSNPFPFAVRGRAAGGYEREGIPNVNDPTNAYRLMTGAPSGQSTAPQFGNQPAFQNQLGQNLDLRQRAEAVDQATADQERREGRTTPRNLYAKDKRWSALLQAMTEAGADRMQTGARAGWEAPGFYDTQATMGAGAQDRQRLLEAMLMNQGRTQDAGFVRGLR
jgi:hypothetical protein